MKYDTISSGLIAKQGNHILHQPEDQIPRFNKKMTPNIGIIQITSQFGPFDNAK